MGFYLNKNSNNLYFVLIYNIKKMKTFVAVLAVVLVSGYIEDANAYGPSKQDLAAIESKVLGTFQDLKRGMSGLNTRQQKVQFMKKFFAKLKDEAQGWRQTVKNMPDGPEKKAFLQGMKSKMQNLFPEAAKKLNQVKGTAQGKRMCQRMKQVFTQLPC